MDTELSTLTCSASSPQTEPESPEDRLLSGRLTPPHEEKLQSCQSSLNLQINAVFSFLLRAANTMQVLRIVRAP